MATSDDTYLELLRKTMSLEEQVTKYIGTTGTIIKDPLMQACFSRSDLLTIARLDLDVFSAFTEAVTLLVRYIDRLHGQIEEEKDI